MNCKICGRKMRLDDRDRISYGKYDNYFVCDTDNISCVERIRCGISIDETWSDKDGNVIGIIKNGVYTQ